MLLRGNLKEFSLPNVFQLVKMSAKTGCLTLAREGEEGKVFFRKGQICYAASSPQGFPLGERLVKAGRITSRQLKAALAEQRISEDAGRLGAILVERGAIDRPTLEQAVREQIEDVTFNFFSWPDGEFGFAAEETVDVEDIVLEMNVENVIMEGCRRIDEWELIFEKLGSLEKVPHLAVSEAVEESGEVALTAEEWRVVCFIDDRRDIGTVLKECGVDRFNGAKVIYSLFSAGLVSVSDPVIEGIGTRRAVVVRGPIDIYNEVFLNTLSDDGVTEHLRIELIDEKEIEIPIHAATFGPNGDGEGQETLVFTTSVGAPEQAWRRLASEGSAFVVLVNANSTDSLRASARDFEFLRSLGDPPLVVATYVSMAEDAVEPETVRKALGLGKKTLVLPCSLRDRGSVSEVVAAAVRQLAAE
jgi:signal recognition particle receptor subunit beta